MNVVLLRVLDASDADDGFRIAAPALSPSERVVIWEGLPPHPAPEHPRLAPVVMTGDLGGRHAYAEQVPRGVRYAEAPPPASLVPYVVSEVVRGLLVLHAAHQVHGAVGPDRVVLGADGEVVLFGRGRQGGLAGLDLMRALALLPGGGDRTLPAGGTDALTDALAAASPPDARERLGRWVAARVRDPVPGTDAQVVLTARPPGGGADEVVPDLGPDSDGEGLLDRWSVSTGGAERTDEVTDGGGSQARLALTLWSRVAAEASRTPPPDRFDRLEGVPSRGVRSLIADEIPAVLPASLQGPVPDFLATDESTVVTPVVQGSDTPTPPVRRASPVPPLPPADEETTEPIPTWTPPQLVLAVAVLGIVAWLLLTAL